MTPQEAALWQRLRRSQLDSLHFRRRQIIDGFIADFYCHAAGVVIELDGAGHLRQVDYDQERDKAIAAHDLCVLRVADDEVDSDLELLLNRIRATCRARIARPFVNPVPKAPPSLKGRGTGG